MLGRSKKLGLNIEVAWLESILEQAAKFPVPKVETSWILSFYYRFVIFFLLFIILQGIDALSFYKGLKYTANKCGQPLSFYKGSTIDTSCSESTRGKSTMGSQDLWKVKLVT